jgi:hypothetical protein
MSFRVTRRILALARARDLQATSRALLKFGGGSSDSYATVRAGASTFFVSFDV